MLFIFFTLLSDKNKEYIADTTCLNIEYNI